MPPEMRDVFSGMWSKPEERPTRVGAHASVDDGFQTLTAELSMTMRPEGITALRRFQGPEDGTAVRAFDVLPGDAILSSAASLNMAALAAEARRGFVLGGGDDGARVWDETIAQLGETLEVDVVEELLPGLGPGVAFAIAHSGPREGEMPPIPGVALAVDVSDREPVERAVAALSRLVQDAVRRDGSLEGSVFQTVATDVGESHRMTFGGASGIPPAIAPCLGWVGDRLVFSTHADHWEGIADVARGSAQNWRSNERVSAVVESTLRPSSARVSALDWTRLLDQIAAYDTELAGNFVDVPFPEWTEDMTDADWELAMKRRRIAQQDAAREASADVRAAIDSFRVVESIGSADEIEGNVSKARIEVRFIR